MLCKHVVGNDEDMRRCILVNFGVVAWQHNRTNFCYKHETLHFKNRYLPSPKKKMLNEKKAKRYIPLGNTMCLVDSHSDQHLCK